MSTRTNPAKDAIEILIAEDSPTQAESLRYILEQKGYRVTHARDGRQALAFIDEHKPTLVIADIVMPEVNGYELCQRIKGDERFWDIPVILLTLLSNAEDVLEGLACGANSFITKPYSVNYLLAHVEWTLADTSSYLSDHVGIEVEVTIPGKSRVITADPQRIVSLLLSTYEAAVQRNTELIQTQEWLNSLNEHLEDLVEQRTAALSAEITERKRAEIAVRKHADRLQNLHRMDQAILQVIESPVAIAQTALLHLRGLLHCQRASVGIFDLEKKEARVFAADVDVKTIVQVGKNLPEEAYGDLEVIRQGRMEIVEDMFKMTSPPVAVRILQQEGILSSINVPLLSAQGLIGALNIGWETPRTITPEETEIAGEVAGAITLAIEQARLLQEMKRHAAELEQRVTDRTAELTAANKELEAFSYSVSHDLRNPLRAMDGFSRILLEKYGSQLPAEAQRYLGLLRSKTQQTSQLVDDLLAFSRLSRQPLNKQRVAPADLVRQALADLSAEQEGRQIEINVGDLPECECDPALLRQVFTNLLSNALKFTRKREVTKIEVGYDSAYFIRDNGVGFDMQHANKLFGVFQRLHNAEDYEGTGAGLAIVQRIINRHGGRAWAEAEVDKGATFYFALGGGT